MRFCHATRRRLCAFMAGVFLLMQGLVLAHACAPVAGLPVPAQAADGVAQASAPRCHEGMAADEAPGDALLCKAHCADEQQVPAAAASADLATLALGWCLWLGAAPLPAADTWAAPATGLPAAAPPGWPPLYLALQVLRN